MVGTSEALQEKELRTDTQRLAILRPFIFSCNICSLVSVQPIPCSHLGEMQVGPHCILISQG